MGPHFNSPDIPFSTEATRDGGSSQFEDLSTDILDSAALKHLDLTNSVKLGEWLGQGSFATVFLGRMEDRTVCVKVLRIVGSMSNTDARKALDQVLSGVISSFTSQRPHISFINSKRNKS